MDVKERKKNEIAKAARELFTEFGYRSVSMEQIAMRASVAKGTLYLYFQDKEALFNYLAKEFLTDMEQFIRSVEAKKLSFLEEIHEVIYKLLRFRFDQKFLYKVMQEARDFKTPTACNVERMLDDTVMRYIERRITAAMEQGIVRPCNPSILGFVVVKVYTALAFEWEENHEPLNENQIAESVSSILRYGLIVQ